MKKVLLGFGIAMCFSFVYKQYYEVNNSTAEVKKERGIYLFTDSEPVAEYEYLGTIKAPWAFGDAYPIAKRKVLNKLDKEYPKANGIIFNFDGKNVNADAILLEE